MTDNPIQVRIAQEEACYILKIYSTIQYQSYSLLISLNDLRMDNNVSWQVKLDALIMKSKDVIVKQIIQSLMLLRSTVYHAQANKIKYEDVVGKKENPGPQYLIPHLIGYIFTLYQSV